MKEWHYIITVLMICVFGFGIALYVHDALNDLHSAVNELNRQVLVLQECIMLEQEKCERVLEQNIILIGGHDEGR